MSILAVVSFIKFFAKGPTGRLPHKILLRQRLDKGEENYILQIVHGKRELLEDKMGISWIANVPDVWDLYPRPAESEFPGENASKSILLKNAVFLSFT